MRDQIGHPLTDGAEVVLEASSGAVVRCFVLGRVDSNLNYTLEVPMDAGLTSDLFLPSALMPAAPFRLRVRIGPNVFLPIEMSGALAQVGLPGGTTRIDLTLGVDADANGLPDAWEKAVAAFLGGPWAPGQIRPGDPYPGSGMTYREVYLVGTYAVAPTEGFALQIVHPVDGLPRLAFTSAKGRRYTVQAADQLGDWKTISFRLITDESLSFDRQAYQAADTRRVEIEPPPANGPTRFYRLIVE